MKTKKTKNMSISYLGIPLVFILLFGVIVFGCGKRIQKPVCQSAVTMSPVQFWQGFPG